MLNFLHIFIVLSALLGVAPVMAVPGSDAEIARLGEAWATLKYQRGDDPETLAKVRALKQEAADLAAKFPEVPGFLYWQAQVLCLEAEIMHSVGSLDRMREARQLLEKADQLDPKSGTTKSLLGSVHYEVPGWPLSFGSDKTASRYLRQALEIEPDGMDPNYFMGDLVLQKGRAAEAIPYLERAAAASKRLPASRVVEGRRTEIFEAIEKARKRLSQ